MIYYISDMHLGHANALRFDDRPFETTEEMAAQILKNWNSRVTDEDTVYILGDAFWHHEQESMEFLAQLKGHKHLICGNHDVINGRLGKCWESISHYLEIKDGDTPVVLCHYPVLFYNRHHYGSVMLYGHLHNSAEWQEMEQIQARLLDRGYPGIYINVGCMLPYMDYTPRTLAELLQARRGNVQKEEE